mmetsp:Transcript_16738/g.54494  ORF Transcript_16738/g.54494 Transcript_16738/m.54494 type:complete len:1036 (+) Transcript_16738:43-3150(+)
MSKLPEDLPWSENAATLLAETDKTSVKAVCTTIRKSADEKAKKAACMEAVTDLAKWSSKEGVYWPESFLMTLFETVMALVADKDRAVQIKAEEAGAAMMDALNPLAVDAMLPLLFKQFEEHRWQTKLGAVNMFAQLAAHATKAVAALLPTVVVKLMEVSQDPKPAIKEAAVKALRKCCEVIDNADVIPLIDAVISANLNPDTEGETCLDRLVSTTYVSAVDEPTLSIIMPVLLRGLKVRGNVGMQRKAAVVVDTMFKLVNNPADVAVFTADLIPTLTKNVDEISIPEVRDKTAEALNTVKVTVGEYEAVKIECSPVEVEAVLSEILTGNAYNSDEVTMWVSQVTAPLFATARPRSTNTVVPYLLGIVSEAEAIINGERFLEVGAEKFGAGKEDVVEEDHDDLAVLCDCEFSLAYGNRVLLHNTRLKLKRGKCYGLIGPNGAGKSTLMRSIAADMVEGFPKEIRSVYVECDVSAAHAEVSCVDFIHMDLPERTKEEIAAQMTAVGFKEDLMWGPVGALSGGWRMRLALSRAMLKEPELLLLDEPTNHLDIDAIRLLEELVSASDITLLVVTHDRAFLGSVCDSILELGRGVLYRHRTNFDGFLEARAARLEAQEAADAADRNTLRREAAWARKQPKARESKSKSRMQAYDNLASRVAATPRDAASLDIAAKGMSRLGTSVATFDSVSVRFGDGYIIRDFSYDFSRGERIGVVGPNGAGKSTFLKALQGMLPLAAGVIKVGETVRFGHYEQEQLAPAGDARVLDFVREAVVQAAGGDGTPADHLREAQQLLRKFIFSQSRWAQPIADLSGGERRRLQLLSTLADKPNFLMLDEPTNDLDFSIMTVLEDYIATYPGVLLLVSHDRAFVDSLVDTLFILPADGSGHIKIWQGSPGSAFSDYLAWRDAEATAAVAEEKRSAAAAAALPVNGGAAAPLGQIDVLVTEGGVAASGTSQPGPKVAADKARRALSQFEVEQLARIEGEMEQLSAKQKTLQAKIDGFDPGRNGYDELTGWSDEIERLKGALETKEEKWLELSERL